MGNPNRDHWGVRLKHIVVSNGISKHMALAAELGVDNSTVSRWLQGGNITIPHLEVLCEKLNVSADWLLFGKGTPSRLTDESNLENLMKKSMHHLPKPIIIELCQLITKLKSREQ